MGGKFYLIAHPDNAIDQESWQRALSNMIFELDDQVRDKYHIFHEDGPVAFEYIDPKCKWRGDPPKPKSFQLRRRWSKNAIQSHLGGRRRSNWSNVARVSQFLCDEFPMQLALVVSEGISRYDDKKGTTIYNEGTMMYYEGTGYWKEVDHRKWPWTNIV